LRQYVLANLPSYKEYKEKEDGNRLCEPAFSRERSVAGSNPEKDSSATNKGWIAAPRKPRGSP